MKKILSWEALKTEVERRRRQGEKIAFTNGCFDILHVGHVRYLREARKRGDLLILGLNSDVSVRAIKGEKRPLLPEAERAEVVASLEAVDYVTLFNETTPLREVVLVPVVEGASTTNIVEKVLRFYGQPYEHVRGKNG
jgi:cytidyltransferase-like protein